MENNLENLRHSTAHLLAAAIKNLYPESIPTIGPSTETGLYYDFDNLQVSPEDFGKIEEEMRSIVKNWTDFQRIVLSHEEALEMFKNNPYKLELIEEINAKAEEITAYKSGDFTDLCRGGHIDSPSKNIRFFKLISTSGAYWRGNEKNKMLTRIYATAFFTEEELKNFIEALESAKNRDHRKLGAELGLFVFSDTVGKGLPLWTEKGATIRRELERFIVDEEIKRGYLHVYTPDIANLALYEKSGHYPYYKDSMYAPITIDEEKYMLRPMTCPHHFELYLSRPRSYKELPVRYAELAKLYRYEQSGELTGLIRVRSFCLADAHIITQKVNAENEVSGALDLITYIANIFGLVGGVDYRFRLSLGDRADETKYYKDDQKWEEAEEVLRQVLKKQSVPFFEAENEAAFYGPKIDVQMKNVHGKEDTAFTVQYDFVMPKRFKLSYTSEDGSSQEPIVIHRSSVGAIERVVAFLIEHFSGNLPLWISPIQVRILPVSDKFIEYGQKIKSSAYDIGIRCELDMRGETLGAKIRDAEKEKIPYIVVVGEKEESGATVSPRIRSVGPGKVLGYEEFFAKVKSKIVEKALELEL